ncbi:uncharacterized protein LOC106176397 isoform X2 [Lingula anatina]|uniref:Uncharacterized protein LOC106176397 isoform X2 n=1 Tax=Lingula anatina TaxID=7574 RepID=A0A1S3JV56_LINAN|nr:uncharacterized protein LOC106176397 isoform X2 [Lingula anatina]XP_013414219.1 uncharacterized protein LOC106176397 isoform X2 [Lingula anatina]|eukprot:XP_013414218.1 uncharacterized protein LOC106176397 isoform X2 [Lingula anatina]
MSARQKDKVSTSHKMAAPSQSTAFEVKNTKEKTKLKKKIATIFQQDMQRLFNNAEFSDIVVRIGGEVIHIHSTILMARLPDLCCYLVKVKNENDTVDWTGLSSQQAEMARKLLRELYFQNNLSVARGLWNKLQKSLCASTDRAQTKDINENNKLTVNTTTAQSELKDLNESVVNNEKNQQSTQVLISAENREDENVPNGDAVSSNEDASVLRMPDNTQGSLQSTEDPPVAITVSGSPQENTRIRDDSISVSEQATSQETFSVSVDTCSRIRYEPCDDIAKDLIELYLSGENGDVILKVGEVTFKCHRCILALRCSYFEAMLGGGWAESQAGEIKLERLNPAALHQLLLYIYGGCVNLDGTDCSILDMVMAGDMYDVPGFKDAVEFLIRRDYCHHFHKPCPQCLCGVVEVLPVADTFHLSTLKDEALKWTAQHFTRVWQEKTFTDLPQEIIDKCYQALVDSLRVDSVVSTVLECHSLIGSLARVKRTEYLHQLIDHVIDKCTEYLSKHFERVLQCVVGNTGPGAEIKSRTMGFDLINDLFDEAIKRISPKAISPLYKTVCDINAKAKLEGCFWTQDFKNLLLCLEEKCLQCLAKVGHLVVNTRKWNQLDPEQKEKVAETGALKFICIAHDKVTAKRPVLTSSLMTRQQKTSISASKGPENSKNGLQPGKGARPKSSVAVAEAGVNSSSTGARRKTASTFTGKRQDSEPRNTKDKTKRETKSTKVKPTDSSTVSVTKSIFNVQSPRGLEAGQDTAIGLRMTPVHSDEVVFESELEEENFEIHCCDVSCNGFCVSYGGAVDSISGIAFESDFLIPIFSLTYQESIRDADL